MTNKYKISELAKDFGVSSKDIIDIVTEKTGAAKKAERFSTRLKFQWFSARSLTITR